MCGFVGFVDFKNDVSSKKNILLKVSPEFHKDLKIYVTLRDVTLQDYIVDLIKKDMNKNK